MTNKEAIKILSMELSHTESHMEIEGKATEYYKEMSEIAEALRVAIKAIDLIDNAPTVPLPDFKEGYKQAIKDGKTNFQRPQGEWIVDEDDDILKPLKCSNCGEVAEWLDGGSQFLSNFCPNCGADMRGDGECPK